MFSRNFEYICFLILFLRMKLKKNKTQFIPADDHSFFIHFIHYRNVFVHIYEVYRQSPLSYCLLCCDDVHLFSFNPFLHMFSLDLRIIIVTNDTMEINVLYCNYFLFYFFYRWWYRKFDYFTKKFRFAQFFF